MQDLGFRATVHIYGLPRLYLDLVDTQLSRDRVGNRSSPRALAEPVGDGLGFDVMRRCKGSNRSVPFP